MPKKKRNRRQRAIDQGFVKSLAHELRAEILLILTERMASPNELSRMLDEGLSQISYHVKVLKDYGRIKLVKTEPRRGAVEHFYRATADTLLPAKVWRGAEGLQTVIGGGLASDLFDDLAEAAEAKRLTEENSKIHRIALLLDADGLGNVSAIIERATQEIEREQRDSSSRVTKAKGKGQALEVTAFTVGMLAFQNGPRSKSGKADASAERINGSKKRGKAANAKRTTGKQKGTTKSAGRSKSKGESGDR